jgi:hypothetical protein
MKRKRNPFILRVFLCALCDSVVSSFQGPRIGAPPLMTTGKARAALIWTLVLFAGQLLLGLALYHRHPEMGDECYAPRLLHLRQRLAEAPGRPLLLVLGSSRPAVGIRPDYLAEMPYRPVVFNFSMPGGGPVRQLLTLRRLLAEGIRPDAIVVEAWAPFLPQHGFFTEAGKVLLGDLYWPDLAAIARLYGLTWEPLNRFLERVAAPTLYYRRRLLDSCARFLPLRAPTRELPWGEDGTDATGWLPPPASLAPDDPAGDRETSRRAVESSLVNFQVSSISDTALRDLLGECRSRGIRVLLLLLPEHSVLRGWYSPQTKADSEDYFDRLGEEYGAPVIDGRTWIADEDFLDFCHLLTRGADAFSTRLGRDVLAPWLAGRPLPAVSLREAWRLQ